MWRVGAAWEELSSKTDMIVRSFEKCGISVAPDGSEDEKINIIGLEDYSVDSDDDQDPFSGEDGEEDGGVDPEDEDPTGTEHGGLTS